MSDKSPVAERLPHWLNKMREVVLGAESEGYIVFAAIYGADPMIDYSCNSYTTGGDHMAVLGLVAYYSKCLPDLMHNPED